MTQRISPTGWLPPAIKENGEVDHDLLLQRVTRCLCLIFPFMVITYKILDACQISDPFIKTIIVTVPLPDLFSFIDEYRAERASLTAQRRGCIKTESSHSRHFRVIISESQKSG